MDRQESLQTRVFLTFNIVKYFLYVFCWCFILTLLKGLCWITDHTVCELMWCFKPAFLELVSPSYSLSGTQAAAGPEIGTFLAIVAGTFLITPTVTDIVVSSVPNYWGCRGWCQFYSLPFPSFLNCSFFYGNKAFFWPLTVLHQGGAELAEHFLLHSEWDTFLVICSTSILKTKWSLYGNANDLKWQRWKTCLFPDGMAKCGG